MNFDLEYIEKLVKMVSDSELTELTLEEKESFRQSRLLD